MMSLMIKENGVTFKELEKNIYAWICQIGREFTKEFLERYDRILMEGRDKKKYRNKGARQTTIKTVYGEVTYQRTVYEVTEEDGTRRFVYLLAETLELDHVGLISTNMEELLVKGITELSYRECASQVRERTEKRKNRINQRSRSGLLMTGGGKPVRIVIRWEIKW